MAKKAFTLAEVLITLGIIGVVAALTLPSLIQSYKEQAMVTRVKKFYSVFSQAYTMAIQENGTIDNWGLEDSVMEADEDGVMQHTDETLEQYDKFFSIMSKYLQKAGYEKLGTERYGVQNKSKENKGYILPDGTAITGLWLRPSTCRDGNETSYCGDFYIHVDNKSHQNAKGKINSNIFQFLIYPNRIFPFGANDELFQKYCLSGEKRQYCTGWVILNGNMDYLHCKDLSLHGKTKCK